MDLGRALVRNLDLDERGATLERWMAHHLAELIVEAETASGDAKLAAETRAADLILRLWERRRDLYEVADPLGPCRDAVEVLSQLRTERNPWIAYQGRGGPEELLGDLFDSMAKVVVGGILLTRAGALREVSPAERDALSREELDLRAQLAWWEAAIKPDIPKKLSALMHIQIVGADGISGENSGLDPSQSAGDAEPGPGDAADKMQDEFDDEPKEILPETRRPKEQVTEALEHLQTELSRLIEAWKSGPGRDGL